ncbi:hypothetical protein ACTFIU_000844 [Dictyostelium citrinum]
MSSSTNPSSIKKSEKTRVNNYPSSTSLPSSPLSKDSSTRKLSSKKQEEQPDSTVHITKVLSKTSIQPPSTSTPSTISSAPSSKTPIFNAPIKILSKQLKFENYETVYNILSKSNTQFTVVGVIGGQSCGKSTLLSSLIKRSYDNSQTQQQQQQQQQTNTSASTTSNTTTTNTTPSSSTVTKDNNLKLFEILTDNNFGLGKHQTIGIDLFISEEERIIYLDTQPLQSLSIICEMLEENFHLPNHYNSYEQYHHMQCLRLIVYLLSICNVVLVVQENKSLDIPFCKLLRSASLILKNKTPDVSNPTQTGLLHNYENDILESTARQLFIFNKLTEIDMNETCFDKSLSVLFSNPKNLYQSFVSNLSNNNSGINSITTSSNIIGGGDQQIGSKYQLMNHFDSFFIPDRYLQEIANNATTEILGVNSSEINPNTINGTKKRQQQQTNTKLQPTFNESIEYLHKHLLLLRSVSKFTHDITERQWFENAQNLWNYIQDCDLLSSYNFQLSKSKYRPLNINNHTFNINNTQLLNKKSNQHLSNQHPHSHQHSQHPHQQHQNPHQQHHQQHQNPHSYHQQNPHSHYQNPHQQHHQQNQNPHSYQQYK